MCCGRASQIFRVLVGIGVDIVHMPRIRALLAKFETRFLQRGKCAPGPQLQHCFSLSAVTGIISQYILPLPFVIKPSMSRKSRNTTSCPVSPNALSSLRVDGLRRKLPTKHLEWPDCSSHTSSSRKSSSPPPNKP